MPGQRQPGITLITVLVAAVAISVILSLVLYSLNIQGRRKLAKLVKCQANLKGLGQASLMYSADDPMGSAIPVAPSFMNELGGAYDYGGKAGLEDFPKSKALQSKWGKGAERGIFDRPLNPYLDKDIPTESTQKEYTGLYALECPSDTGDTTSGWNDSPPGFKASRTMGTNRFRKSGRSASDYYGTSYVANTLWCYFEEDGTPVALPGNGESPIYSVSPFLHSTDAIRNPSGIITYMEANGRYAARWAGNLINNACFSSAYGITGETMGWHGETWKFMATYLDGHVSIARIDGSHKPSPLSALIPQTDENVDLSIDWTCLRFSGMGWQLDTLPLKPVKTHHTKADAGNTKP